MAWYTNSSVIMISLELVDLTNESPLIELTSQHKQYSTDNSHSLHQGIYFTNTVVMTHHTMRKMILTKYFWKWEPFLLRMFRCSSQVYKAQAIRMKVTVYRAGKCQFLCGKISLLIISLSLAWTIQQHLFHVRHMHTYAYSTARDQPTTWQCQLLPLPGPV